MAVDFVEKPDSDQPFMLMHNFAVTEKPLSLVDSLSFEDMDMCRWEDDAAPRCYPTR